MLLLYPGFLPILFFFGFPIYKPRSACLRSSDWRYNLLTSPVAVASVLPHSASACAVRTTGIASCLHLPRATLLAFIEARWMKYAPSLTRETRSFTDFYRFIRPHRLITTFFGFLSPASTQPSPNLCCLVHFSPRLFNDPIGHHQYLIGRHFFCFCRTSSIRSSILPCLPVSLLLVVHLPPIRFCTLRASSGRLVHDAGRLAVSPASSAYSRRRFVSYIFPYPSHPIYLPLFFFAYVAALEIAHGPCF